MAQSLKAFRGLLLLPLLLLMLAACSSTDGEEDLGPAPLVDFEAEKQFDKLWSSSLGDGQGGLYNRLTPAIDGDIIYVTEVDGDVEALNRDNGKSLWDVNIDASIIGGVGVGGGLVMVGTAAGNVVALDQDSGEQRWSAFVSGEALSPPQSNGDVVIVQTFDGMVLGLHAGDGSRIWSFTVNVPVLTLRGTSTPLLYRDSVIVGFANGRVMSFEIATGKVRWDTRVAVPQGNSEIERIVDVDGQLLLMDNTVYAVSYQGQIAAIDVNSGQKRWARDASSYVNMAHGFGNIYVSGQDGSVTAFIRNGQGLRWSQTVLARRSLTGPVVMDSYVVVGDGEGYLHALSQVDGHLAARVKVDSSGIQSTLLVDGDVLYVYTNDGRTVAYRLEDISSGFFGGFKRRKR